MSAEQTYSLDALSALTPGQQAALALIGITDERQLAGADADRLWSEMQEARLHFPDEPHLSREEWERAILPLLPAKARSTAKPLSTKTPAKDFPSPRNRSLPKLAHRNSSGERGEFGMLPFRRRHKKGIRHQHVFRTLTIASSVLLFYACLAGIGVWLVSVVFFSAPHQSPNIPLLSALLVGLLPFALFGWMSRCSVCNIGLFSWKRYHRNRQCHKIPLLGYQLPTALHILLFFWFRCPSCGTPQELRRK